jgi:hypothetical protein
VPNLVTEHDLNEWVPEVSAMIANHHKIRPYRGPFTLTVDAFRRADWIDVSLGHWNGGQDRAPHITRAPAHVQVLPGWVHSGKVTSGVTRRQQEVCDASRHPNRGDHFRRGDDCRGGLAGGSRRRHRGARLGGGASDRHRGFVGA